MIMSLQLESVIEINFKIIHDMQTTNNFKQHQALNSPLQSMLWFRFKSYTVVCSSTTQSPTIVTVCTKVYKKNRSGARHIVAQQLAHPDGARTVNSFKDYCAVKCAFSLEYQLTIIMKVVIIIAFVANYSSNCYYQINVSTWKNVQVLYNAHLFWRTLQMHNTSVDRCHVQAVFIVCTYKYFNKQKKSML